MPPGAVIVGFAVGGAAGIAERRQLEVGFMQDAYVVLIIAVVAAVVAALLVVVLARRGKGDLERRLAVEEERSSRTPGLERALSERSEQITDLRARLAALQETLDQERKQAVEKVALLSDAKERMTQEFKLLAIDVMQLHGENFSKQNKEQIDAVLAPLREKLGEFQQGIQAAHMESTKERATLAEQIRQITENSAKITIETSNLTRALKGEAQGAWGEMILGSILEKSGLRKGDEYVAQQSYATDDGQKIRPDVVVKLPGSRPIVVDSKQR